MTLGPEKCQWNLVGRSMVEGKPVECWGILDFTLRSKRIFRGDVFISKLIEKYSNFGIHINEPVWIGRTDMWKLGNYNPPCELPEKINDENVDADYNFFFTKIQVANASSGFLRPRLVQ